MKKYYRKLVLSYSPLKCGYRFEDRFQIIPLDMTDKPKSPYIHHYPLFLEYTIDFESNEPQDLLALGTIRFNTEKEILNLLSCLTNHRFFNYDTSMVGWGVILPNKSVEELSLMERDILNRQESNAFMGGYIYSRLKEDLMIERFTENIPATIFKEAQMHEYYTDNPIDDYKHEIYFPNTLDSALHFYYGLSPKTRMRVKSCIYLACDGIDVSIQKRTLSFLSYVSALEGLVNLEIDDDEIKFKCGSCKAVESSPYTCPKCGKPIWGIKQKFVSFLSKFVAGSEDSKKIYSKIYNLRSRMTHTSQLFDIDYELSFDLNNTEEDWLMRLKTLQLFRIALNSWLRYTNKKKK